MGCGPNMIPKLQQKYGDKLLHWVQSQVGASLVKEQFGLTRKGAQGFFNSGNFGADKMSLFNDVIGKINDNQVRQVNQIKKDQPNIPQLDSLNDKQKNAFMKKATSYFKEPLDKYKSGLLGDLDKKGVLDFKKYVPSSLF